MFVLDEKQYDETKMNDEGKTAYQQMLRMSQREIEIQIEVKNLTILKESYLTTLKNNLPKEEKIKKEK